MKLTGTRRKVSVRTVLAAVLCGCLTAGAGDVSAFAAQEAGSAAAVLDGSKAADALTEWGEKPDEQIVFGAYALSGTEFCRRTGTDVTMKVYAWSTRDELDYYWYDPNGYEMQEEGDTLTITDLSDKEGESGFGTYRCVISDGVDEKQIEFEVFLETTLSVEYGSEAEKECYVGEPVNLSISARDFGEPEKPVSYQWYLNRKYLDGETDSVLSVPHSGKEGETVFYRCEVTDGVSAVSKEFKVLTKKNNFSAELVAPGRLKPNGSTYYYPARQEVVWDVKLVNYNPYAEYKYTWYRKRKINQGAPWPVSSASGSQVTILENGHDVLEYSCRITDGTNSYTLINYVYPAFKDVDTDMSSTRYAKPGKPIFFDLDIKVTEGIDLSDVTFQWYKKNTGYGDDELLAGETKMVLKFSEVREDDYGDYYCRVSWGDGESRDIHCSLERYKYSIRQSAIGGFYGNDITYTVGSDLMNEIGLDGNVSFQWYEKLYNGDEEGTPIAGATERTLIKTFEQENRDCVYYCKVTEEDGQIYESFESNDITLLTSDEMFVIKGQDTVFFNRAYGTSTLLDPGIEAGSSVGERLRIAWYRQVDRDFDGTDTNDWVSLDSKERTYELNLDELDKNEELYCAVVNRDTSTFSTEFFIRPEETLASGALTQLDASGVIRAETGRSVKLAVEAYSIMPQKVTYRWKKSVVTADGEVEVTDLRGSGPTCSITGIDDTKYGVYICEITDGNEIHSYEFPVVAYDFENRSKEGPVSVYPGQKNVSLNADVTYGNKSVPVTYRWMRAVCNEDGEMEELPIGGATTETLTFDVVMPDDLGSYVCIVSAGDKTLRLSYELNGTDRFSINGKPGQESYVFYAGYGDRVRLTAAADIPAGEAVSYQWMKKGKAEDTGYYPVSGASSAEYSLPVNTPDDFGSYLCRITVNRVVYDLYVEIMDSDSGLLTANAEHAYSNVKNVGVIVGQTAKLRAVACCRGHELQYQWEKADSSFQKYEAITGASMPECSVLIRTEDQLGVYRCAVTCKADDETKYVYYHLIAMETDPEEPDKPEKPDDSNKPGKPTDPENPDDPNKPGEPDDPNKPGEPTDPEEPDKPEKPDDPNKPGKPTDPEEPDKPGEPDDPQNPDDPNKPGEPDDPNKPGKPTEPEKPDDSNKPGNPGSDSNPSVSVTAIRLNKTELVLKRGGQETLLPLIEPENASGHSVKWFSSDSKVVEVVNGIVTAKENGTAVITASVSDGQFAAQCSVRVITPAEKIYLLPVQNMTEGTNNKLVATLLPADTTEAVKWKSSNPKTARVDEKGNVSAIAVGTAKITAATESGKKAVCTVTVVKKAVKAVRVKLSRRKISLTSGQIIQLKTAVSPGKSTERIKWSSSDKKVVTIDRNGVLTAKKPGKAKITVKTDSGKKDTCTVTVKQRALSVSLNKTSASVKVGKTIRLKAVMNPGNSSDQLKWTSSNKRVATVSRSGVVKGIKKGSATITVKTENGKTAKCKIIVK